MKKLKVAFLWHQHQPYYKIDNEFILPWVLLHGTKDYFDIPEVLYEFPKIKQTFNFAPSLSMQLDEYIAGTTKDKIQRLTALPSTELSENEKREIIELFFHANFDNMIAPYQRYLELFNRAQWVDDAVANFSVQDWLDLQVWYNLVWFGYYSSQSGIIRRLFQKGRDFTEFEKISLQQEQNNVLKKINYQYRKLKELSQIELSCSPMYHPILPLLINSKSAHEARPGQDLPEPIFNFPEDAELQIKLGLEYFKKTFDDYPQGVWPSEGSVSDETLKLMINSGIQWVATDEQVLFNSLKGSHHAQTEKFFPRKFVMQNGAISVLFRDHFLSDRIGFTYSKWNERDAANDFTYHLRNIRNEIIKNHGEDALDYACVSVILDGENCWEYYRENGIPFLRELFGMLSNSEEVTTITCSEAIHGNNYLPALNHIVSGSWINANFDIWIGHEDDIKAWSILSSARHELRRHSDSLSPERYEQALKSLLIAEGSDWFWWYGPEHQTKNKPDFDRLFRHYVLSAYSAMGLTPPDSALIPIEHQQVPSIDKEPTGRLKNLLANDLFENIENGGFIKLKSEMSSMHRIGDLLDSVSYSNDNEHIYIKLAYLRNMKDNFEVRLFFDNIGKDIFIDSNTLRTDIHHTGIIRNEEYLIIILPLNIFNGHEFIHTRIESFVNNNLLKYPAEGAYKLKIV